MTVFAAAGKTIHCTYKPSYQANKIEKSMQEDIFPTCSGT